MNCPNDRYVNDGAICQAVAANLARIGVKINLAAETKGTYFPKILRRDTSFYMLGWTSDHRRRAQRAVRPHVTAWMTRAAGPVQPGRLQQSQGRRAHRQAIQSETDKAKRNEMIQRGLQDPRRTTSATSRCTSRRWPGA